LIRDLTHELLDTISTLNFSATFFVDVQKVDSILEINALRRAVALNHTLGLMIPSPGISFSQSINQDFLTQKCIEAAQNLANIIGFIPLLTLVPPCICCLLFFFSSLFTCFHLK